jgi:hypothetical protein
MADLMKKPACILSGRKQALRCTGKQLLQGKTPSEYTRNRQNRCWFLWVTDLLISTAVGRMLFEKDEPSVQFDVL